MTWLGRGTGHQSSPQAWKSACHGMTRSWVSCPGGMLADSTSRNGATNWDRIATLRSDLDAWTEGTAHGVLEGRPVEPVRA